MRKKTRQEYLDEFGSLCLGMRPDSEIASESGISRRKVAWIRKRLGIKPFSGLLLTQEGIPCRSILEAKYDAWLHWKGKKHKHNPRVRNLPYFADFFVDGSYVEIVGMLPFKKYAEKIKRKLEAYDRHRIPCMWIEPGSLEYIVRDCPLSLRFSVVRQCLKCSLKTHDLVNGMCRKCNRKDWGIRNAVAGTCKNCGEDFRIRAGTDSKFCSQKCYWQSLRHKSPSKDALAQRRYRERKKSKKV